MGQPGRQLTRNLMTIDLDDIAPTREAGNESGAGKKIITLPASFNYLLLRLPKGSERGIYIVSIQDAAGKTVVSAKAAFSNGKSLRVDLDMRKLPAMRYLLSVSRGDEAPYYYTISVTAEKMKTRPKY